MKPRRRKPSAPKVVNGHAKVGPSFAPVPAADYVIRQVTGVLLVQSRESETDREFGPWVRGPDGRLWRAKRL